MTVEKINSRLEYVFRKIFPGELFMVDGTALLLCIFVVELDAQKMSETVKVIESFRESFEPISICL